MSALPPPLSRPQPSSAAVPPEDDFARLMAAWSRLVFSTALRRLGGDAHSAEEITQNVFLTAHRKTAVLAKAACPAAWLHRAALLECSNFLRAEHRRRRKLEAFAAARQTVAAAATPAFLFPSSSDAGVGGTFDAGSGGGDGSGFSETLHARLDEALAALRDADRELILSRFLEGRSFQEIADLRRSSPDAVRVRLNRLLEKLARRLRRRDAAVLTGAVLTTALTTQWTHAAPALLTASLHAAGTGAAAAALTAASSPAAVAASVTAGSPAACSVSSSAVSASTAAAGGGVAVSKIPVLLTLMCSGKTLGLTALAALLALLSLQPQAARLEDLRVQLARQAAAAAAGRAALSGANPALPAKPGGLPPLLSTPASLAAFAAAQADSSPPLTARELLKEARAGQQNGFGLKGPASPRLKRMSGPELLQLLSDLENIPAGAGLKSATRSELISGFLAKKEPEAAIREAIRLRFRDSSLRQLAANLVKADPEAGQRKLTEFLKNPDSLPAPRFGSNPVRALRQGIGETLAEENPPAAIKLCQDAAGTPAAADYLLGMARPLARKETPGTLFGLLGGIPAPDDRRAVAAQFLTSVPDPAKMANDPRFPQEFRKAAVLEAAMEMSDKGITENNLYALHLISSTARPEDRQAITVDWLRQARAPSEPQRYYPENEEARVDQLVTETLRIAAPADPAAARKWLVLVHNPELRARTAAELKLTAP